MLAPIFKLKKAAADPFAIFNQKNTAGEQFYVAGLPSYPANFSRDVFVAGIIAGREDLLISQLKISAFRQGKKSDKLNGEEPGKIHHQYPGGALAGRSGNSTYNACDTTSLFLIALENVSYLDEARAERLVKDLRPNIDRAIEYLKSHIKSDCLFWECPPTGARRYNLRVTYWKDSILPNTTGQEEPIYPIIYPLAHFMAARALLSASRLIDDQALAKLADEMFINGIGSFIGKTSYTAYLDKSGPQRQASSDEMHSLAYIPLGYKKILPLVSIKKRARQLATPYGYVCTPVAISRRLSDKYHGDKVWTYEQAMIHYGTSKFGLYEPAKVAEAIDDLIGEGQEQFGIYRHNGEVMARPEGNEYQLWSVAAREYFDGNSFLRLLGWL